MDNRTALHFARANVHFPQPKFSHGVIHNLYFKCQGVLTATCYQTRSMHCGPAERLSSLYIAHAAPHIVALWMVLFLVGFDR
jgi:hypothetical protein